MQLHMIINVRSCLCVIMVTPGCSDFMRSLISVLQKSAQMNHNQLVEAMETYQSLRRQHGLERRFGLENQTKPKQIVVCTK